MSEYRERALPRKVERDDGQLASKHVDDLHRQVDPARARVQADAEVGRAYPIAKASLPRSALGRIPGGITRFLTHQADGDSPPARATPSAL